jgi:phage tail tube protein FII
VRLSPELIEKNRQTKAGVVNGIAGLKAGIDKLDAAFKNNPKLQVQYVNLFGVSESVVRARDLAANNQFDEAGRALIAAVERLTNILLEIK